jgi:hypothetical protein
MKEKPLKPAPTIEQVTDMLLNSMQDHDTGWAYVTHAPIFKHKGSADLAFESIVEFVIPQYNTVQKKYIITVKEA